MHDFAELNLIGRSPAFLNALSLLKKFATCDATVLIEGETGTGKELAARAIHYLSHRREFPFIPVNCGALPDSLMENELFGHARGAFTDAREPQLGLVAHAERGTLFLDEIECLPPKGQVVLLRFLQDRVYRPLGGRQALQSNVRVVAASNSDLARMALNGKIREDLLYRLAIMSITLPALRMRGSDVILLTEHLLRRFAHQYGRKECKIDKDSVTSLLNYSWPGNVRELENLVHREFLLAEGDVIKLRNPLTSVSQGEVASCRSDSYRTAKAQAISAFDQNFLVNLMERTCGNVSAAAARAGKERRSLGKLLKKYGIDPRKFQQA